MTEKESNVLRRCIKELAGIDELLEEWEPALQMNFRSGVRQNLLIRYTLLSQIAALECVLNNE